MKVICNRGALLEALSVVTQAVPTRTPKPVLQCIKLAAADDKLTLAATDMDIAVRYSNTQVQVEQDGETLVPADKLRDIVRESIDDTLSIELRASSASSRGATAASPSTPRTPRTSPRSWTSRGTPTPRSPAGSSSR